MANVSVVSKPGYYRVRRGKLVAHVKRGYVLIACSGDAHKPGNGHVEGCSRCADGPWGWCAVRVAPQAKAEGVDGERSP